MHSNLPQSTIKQIQMANKFLSSMEPAIRQVHLHARAFEAAGAIHQMLAATSSIAPALELAGENNYRYASAVSQAVKTFNPAPASPRLTVETIGAVKQASEALQVSSAQLKAVSSHLNATSSLTIYSQLSGVINAASLAIDNASPNVLADYKIRKSIENSIAELDDLQGETHPVQKDTVFSIFEFIKATLVELIQTNQLITPKQLQMTLNLLDSTIFTLCLLKSEQIALIFALHLTYKFLNAILQECK